MSTLLSVSDLMAFFKDEHKSIKRGGDHYKSGHVEKCSYSDGKLTGLVRASMKHKVYPVSLSVAIKFEQLSNTMCSTQLSAFYKEKAIRSVEGLFQCYINIFVWTENALFIITQTHLVPQHPILMPHCLFLFPQSTVWIFLFCHSG